MKSTKLLLLFFSIIIINNCSHHKVKIDAVVLPDQMTDYEGVVTSEKKHTVSLTYFDLGMLNKKTKFKIMVENHGDNPIDFSNDNISVMFEGNSIDWSSKKIEIEKPVDVMRGIIGETIRRRTINTRHSSHTTLDSSSLPVNALLTGDRELDRNTMEWILEGLLSAPNMVNRGIKTKSAQSSYSLPRMLIRPQIIMPNESISGFFVCDTRKMKNKVKGNFIISIKVGDEEHKFIFTRS